jgi:hypothetical protein
VLHVLVELGQVIHLADPAVYPQPHEALRAQLVEEIRLLAFAPDDERREDHDARVGRPFEHVVHHLRHALRREQCLVLRAVRVADARVEQAQVVVDLGNRAHGRARVVAGRLLLDRNGRGQPLDQVDVGLFHDLQELPGVGRQRLDVAALAFGVERVEGERGLAGAGEARDDDQPVARQVEADVLQIVSAGPAHADVVEVRDAGLAGIAALPVRPVLLMFRTGLLPGREPHDAGTLDGHLIGIPGEESELNLLIYPSCFLFPNPPFSRFR